MTQATTGLAELLDKLLDKGVVASGGLLVSLAGVDLVRLDLRLLLSSIERLLPADDVAERASEGAASLAAGAAPRVGPAEARELAPAGRAASALASRTAEPAGAGRLERLPAPPSGERVDLEPENVERGLGRLVVTLLEVLREVLERQSLRRVQGGTLAPEQVERLGLTLRALELRLRELRDQLGVHPDEPRVAIDRLFPSDPYSTPPPRRS
jgi:hypothetical protein